MMRLVQAGLMRISAFASAVLLAGCSALQIDVDVYKGALNHEPDIQAQQYAVLAMAAKPVLATLRNEMYRVASGNRADSPDQNATNENLPEACREAYLREGAEQDKRPARSNLQWSRSALAGALRLPTGTSIPAQERNRYSYWMRFDGEAARGAYFINGLLSYYEPDVCVHRDDDWHRARPDTGLLQLFNDVRNAAIKLERGKRDTNLTAAQKRELRADLDSATEYLTGELIPFAERILFVVNNPSLFSDDNYRIERAILQTLGNSLILHANDLRRRQAHEANQQMRFDAQRRAAEPVTAAQGPAVLLDSVARRVASTSSRAAAVASAASAAVTASQTALAEVARSADSAASAAERADKALKAWKHPVPAVNAAHATLVDPAAATDVPAAEQDRAALTARAAAFKPGETVTARALADDLLAWVTQERDPKLAAGQRQKRIEGLARALHRTEPLVSMASIPPGPAPQMLTTLKAAIAAAQARHLAGRDELAALLAKAQTGAEAAVKRKQDAQAVVDTKKREHKEADDVDKRARAANKAITEAMTGAIAATTGTPGMHPEAVRQVLLAKLEAVDATKASADDKSHAQAALAAMTLQPAFSFRTGDFSAADETHGNRKTAMQVLEDLIAYLRTRRTAVLADKGDGEEAQNLAKAIESAEQQRTDQVFLRPASDYLRNVYASTALADETRPANRNMLLDYIRNLNPNSEKDNMGLQRGKKFLCELKEAVRDRDQDGDGPPPDDKDCDPGRDIEKARADLEKLFWQNINRVTTNGGTNANHVIAKDDVGNWYIKTFSTDPKQVFESAKSLLLFNQGGKIDSNLLRRAELRDQSRNGTTEEKAAANTELGKLGNSPAGLAVGGRAQKRFQDRYADETKELALALQQRIPGLPEKELAGAWAAVMATAASAPAPAASATPPAQTPADLTKALVTGASQLQNGSLGNGLLLLDSHVKRLADPAQSPSKLGGQIVAVLNLLVGYRDDLVALAQQQPGLTGAANSDRLKAINEASQRTIKRLIEEVVQQRQRTVDSYQEGLASIADTVR